MEGRNMKDEGEIEESGCHSGLATEDEGECYPRSVIQCLSLDEVWAEREREREILSSMSR